MRVLSLGHGENAPAGVFGDVVEERGHELQPWSFTGGAPMPRPLEEYGAVLVFGGSMHADQDERHPWLRQEKDFLQKLLRLGTPTLGVCLGVQLLAGAAGAPVMPAAEPEIGWVDVELTATARDDPVFSQLPARFRAFQWHYYTYGVPDGAVELARSAGCTQAFRLHERIWGIQFHAEVTGKQIEEWVRGREAQVLINADEVLVETRQRIDQWNELGRKLCRTFVEAAERVPAA